MEEVVETAQDENVLAEESTVEEEPQEEVEEEETKETPWYEKRFAKLTYQREEAKRQWEAEKERAEKLQQLLDKAITKEEPPPERPVGKPKAEDFDTDEDFFDALTDWKLEQREKAVQEKREQAKREEEQKKQEMTAQEREAEFRTNAIKMNQEGRGKYKDYEQVVFSLPSEVMTRQLAEAILDTDLSADIAYHLGKNPEEAGKIAQLSPTKQAIALGKIESRISNQKKEVSNAPPPINPLKGKDSDTLDPDEILERNPDEWIRLRNEGKI